MKEVEIQARAIARALIKIQLKVQGIKVSLVEDKQITAAAKRLVKLNPYIYQEAREIVKSAKRRSR